jgi:hypothetical protein
MKTGANLPPRIKLKKGDMRDVKGRRSMFVAPPGGMSRTRYAGTSRPHK